MRLTTLIAALGSSIDLPELAVQLARDCSKVQAINPAEWCFVYFPLLRSWRDAHVRRCLSKLAIHSELFEE
jgi:hypothetical protein